MAIEKPDTEIKPSIEQAYASPTADGISLMRPNAKRFWMAFALMSLGYAGAISCNLFFALYGGRVEPWVTFLLLVAFYWIAYFTDARIRSARVSRIQWLCVACLSIVACFIAIYFFRAHLIRTQPHLQSLVMAWFLLMVAFVHLSNAIADSLVEPPAKAQIELTHWPE